MKLYELMKCRFVVRIPEKLAPEQVAPLLCAGVTAYSPLKQFMGCNRVVKGGILGLGGVGHLGVIIAKAMGHHVTVISSSNKKREEALEILGADAFIVSSNEAEMEGAASSLDYILDTVPAFHPLHPYLSLLTVEGKLIIVAAVPKPLQFDAADIILGIYIKLHRDSFLLKLQFILLHVFCALLYREEEHFRELHRKHGRNTGNPGVLGRQGFDDYDRDSKNGIC